MKKTYRHFRIFLPILLCALVVLLCALTVSAAEEPPIPEGGEPAAESIAPPDTPESGELPEETVYVPEQTQIEQPQEQPQQEPQPVATQEQMENIDMTPTYEPPQYLDELPSVEGFEIELATAVELPDVEVSDTSLVGGVIIWLCVAVGIAVIAGVLVSKRTRRRGAQR